ncbi:MAG: hypothetical protein J6S67_19845 [Methanobrevibacter sp.]|nr:hypothetical protein [Methanobrevibacter sp.]
MSHKFFTNDIESDFIKQFLNKTPVPIMDVAVDGRQIYSGFKYIYNGNIIECYGDGIVGKTAVFGIVDSAENAPCDVFTSTVNYYDQKTHKRLGKYLRYYRDTTGIDLMPFYNCFNYDNFVDFYLTNDGYVLGSSDDYKVLAVPIKLNMKYTIAVDCPSEVLIKPVFHYEFGMVKSKNLVPLSDYTTAQRLSYLSFNRPIVIETRAEPDHANEMYDKERYLYLAIQLPKNNDSSLVVLEGDWTKNYDKIFSADYGENKEEFIQKQNELMYRDIGLLLYSDGTSYAYSDRLIEYLLLNVITSQETIDGNIEYTQRNINAKELNDYIKGTWTNDMRTALWYKYKNWMSDKTASEKNPFRVVMVDMNGFVDKDMEQAFLEG